MEIWKVTESLYLCIGKPAMATLGMNKQIQGQPFL